MIKFPKLLSTLLSTILLVSATFAQSERQRVETYINQYKELAINEMLRTGVPASITLAQGIIETAGGQSDLAAIANNHFGIKCKAEWTGETMLHNDDAKNECFRKYSTPEDSYKDHSDFLKTRPMYAFLFKLDPTDYEGWAKGLKKAGYATSSTYAQGLIRVIVENNLQQYSLLAMHRQTFGNDLFATGALAQNDNVANDDDLVDTRLTSPVLLPHTAKELAKTTSYPFNSVFDINEAKVVYAEAGTSLLALANNYNVSLSKLIEFNDLDKTDILNSNQLIFLQKKSKKSNKEIHIVEANETLHDIAQKEGIQLSTIIELNNLQKGMQPATGEKIYLRSPSPSTPKLAVSASYKAEASM
ncbi:MAG TPA: glucosaminidase domain-containing protein [Segetibacter sp.]